MKKYYEAYDQRYRLIHEKGYSWSGSEPTPIVSKTMGKYSVSQKAAILEIGCGEGRDAFALLENGYDVLATDISAEAIDYCRKLNGAFYDHFAVLDCINDTHDHLYDFIYSIAVIHMLVEDEDRKAFYRFIKKHLSGNGIALICSMGDGISESASDPAKSFYIVTSDHESGPVNVPATSLRMVSLETFEQELTENDLMILETEITSSLPDFNNLLYAVITKNKRG